MPMQQGKSGLAAKYGQSLTKAVKTHADAPVEYGRTQLPPGVNNGVAQLTDCYFATYKSGPNQGEYYFRAVGVAIEPKSIRVGDQMQPVAGGQTSIMEPVCATKNQKGETTTQEAHVKVILNHMKMLGAEFDADNADGNTLEQVAAALKKAKPFFRFSTSVRRALKPGDPDGVWENWHGTKGLEEYTPSEEGGVEDSSGEPQTETEGGDEPPVESEGGEVDQGEGDDLDALASAADAGDAKAQKRLEAIADEVWADDAASREAFGEASSWADGAEMLKTAQGEAAAEPEPEPEPEEPEKFAPTKGDIYDYYPTVTNPKTKKKAKAAKPVEVSVTAVNNKLKTCDLLHKDGKTAYKGVKFNDEGFIS